MAVAQPVARPERKPPISSDGRVERDRLRMMMLIRRLEERTFTEYANPRILPDGTREQKIGGFCHLYSGQEAVSVGIAAVYDKSRDTLINAYRCHGHSLALGMQPRAVMAELFGKATGCSKGKGGSMHLFQAEVGNHGGHGIVGGHLPVALGFAFSQKYRKNGGATICLFGDGAINQGTFNESMNMASLYKLPVVYAVENNGVAMGTQIERHSAERDLAKRGAGYNMPYYNVDGMDLDRVIEAVGEAFDRCRKGEGPTFLSINTYRYRGHSMSDPLKYRSKEEAEKWRARDPIVAYAERLKASKLITDADVETMQEGVNAEVEEAVKQAEADPHPALEERFDDILAETYPYDGSK
jgi:pyruvate dehydrogenase E1 component alpha subunit